MKLERIKLLNFRNYTQLELNNLGNVNILIGNNGSGKTNFLEAIYMLSAAVPFRSVNLSEIVQWGQKYFYIRGEFEHGITEVGFSPAKKVLKHNGDKLAATSLPVLNPVVVFEPDDILILTGPPSLRRKFLDYGISLIDSQYIIALRRYQRALRQRNAQLKLNYDQSLVWNSELIKWGSQIIRARLKFIRLLQKNLKHIYSLLFGEEITLRYYNPFKIRESVEDSFQEALNDNLSKELKARVTLIGPHRDNFLIFQKDKQVVHFASQGQLRTLSLALKMGLIANIRETSGKYPIVLLDDVLLEIDSLRRELFLNLVLPDHQTFITLTTFKWIEQKISDYLLYEVGNNSITLKK